MDFLFSPPVSDRLRELQHQRALIQEHLAWLDREISAAQGAPASGKISPGVPANVPVASIATPVVSAAKAAVVPAPTGFADAAAAERAAEELIAQYHKEGQSLQSSVKRGCFLYFFAALAIVGLGVLVLYLRTRS